MSDLLFFLITYDRIGFSEDQRINKRFGLLSKEKCRIFPWNVFKTHLFNYNLFKYLRLII